MEEVANFTGTCLLQRVSHKLTITYLNTFKFLALTCALICCQIGCNATQETSGRAASEAPLRFLGRLLIGYSRDHRGANPGSNDEFLEYLEENRSQWTDDASASAADLLVSPYDGKPMVIVPKNQTGPAGPTGYKIIAFESEGSGTKRWTINERGGIVELENQELSQLFPKLL